MGRSVKYFILSVIFTSITYGLVVGHLYLWNERIQCAVLGDQTQSKVWVYLCDATSSFDDRHDVAVRQVIERMGQATHTKWVAVAPKDRDFKLDNQLCWSADNQEAARKTYQFILKSLRKYGISEEQILGLVGFRHGGTYLAQLSMQQTVPMPLIAIDGTHPVNAGLYPNKLYLITDRNNKTTHPLAQDMYRKTLHFHCRLQVQLIDHACGSTELPIQVLSHWIKHFPEVAATPTSSPTQSL